METKIEGIPQAQKNKFKKALRRALKAEETKEAEALKAYKEEKKQRKAEIEALGPMPEIPPIKHRHLFFNLWVVENNETERQKAIDAQLAHIEAISLIRVLQKGSNGANFSKLTHNRTPLLLRMLRILEVEGTLTLSAADAAYCQYHVENS